VEAKVAGWLGSVLDPWRRYATARDLAEELARYVVGEPILARPVGPIERAIKWARRKPAVAALLGLVALVSAAGLGGVNWQWRAAVRARDLAQARTQDALAAKAAEMEQAELTRQHLYDARMSLVQRNWETLTLEGHFGIIESVTFSPDGKRLASASQDKTVKLWNLGTGEEIYTLEGHTDAVNSVAFSPDGKRVVSGSRDHTIRVWDTATAQEVLSLVGHRGSVRSVVFSLDGKRIASASEDRTVRVWDARELDPKAGQ
jgi:dipeptidyl aminopeptidase/acylaminoacyl peptidase